MDLVQIPRNPEKEVFTLKAGDHYFAFITSEEGVFLVPETFSSPLVASNKARSLKRVHKIQVNLKKTEKAKTPSKLQPKCIFYTEAEVTKLTHLRFRESWFIVAPKGGYVKSVMEDNKVVEYAKDLSKAKDFKSYEEASDYMKTLDLVVQAGHSLRRYFKETQPLKRS